MKIIFGMAVGPSDEMPRPQVKPQSYAEYLLIILSQEEKKEIARVTADENGNYRVALPPGNYVLDVQNRVAKHVRAAPRPFTIVSNQTGIVTDAAHAPDGSQIHVRLAKGALDAVVTHSIARKRQL